MQIFEHQPTDPESTARPLRGSSAEDREKALGAALRALRKSHDELKQTQLQLIQAVRLDSIGRLAAGVAHEVKNPLAIILGNIQLLRLRIPPAEATDELLEDMEVATRRANSVVMGLLDFAASTSLDLHEIAIEEVVGGAIQLVHHDAARRHVQIHHVSEVALPRLKVDHTKIEQVLVNFLMNALDAMENGGAITVRTSLQRVLRPGHGAGVRNSDVLRIGQTVAAVEVEDNGTGIPPEVLQRAFEPFYTTKGPGKGTGLGLAVCKMIAQLHQGSVWLENRAEGGTRATLWLPAGDAQREAS